MNSNGGLMKTTADIEELKKSWASDPCWDLFDTEGFENHRGELEKYQQEMEEKWSSERNNKLEEKAAKLGVSVEVVKAIESCEHKAKYSTDKAKSLLLHYFDLAGVVKSSDNRCEIEDVIEYIIDGAVAASTAAILKGK